MFLVFTNLSLKPLEWFLYAYFCLIFPVLIELLKVENRKIKYLIRLQIEFDITVLILSLLNVEIDRKFI